MRGMEYYRMMLKLFNQMKQRGITPEGKTAEHLKQLQNEYELIKQKRSTLPALQRQAITELFHSLT